MPHVLNMSGRKGAVPDSAVYIGRANRFVGLQASRWANPFTVGKHGTRAEVIARYRAWLCNQPDLLAALPELRGRDLACWCSSEECHGDVLLELANNQ